MIFNKLRASLQGQPKKAPFQTRAGSERWKQQPAGQRRHTVRVVDVVRETPNASTFVVSFPDDGSVRYRAGQYLTVLCDVDGLTYRRAYSFSSSPEAGQPPAITVKRVGGGIVSNHLNDRVRPGDTFEVLGPNGEFTLADTPDRSGVKEYVLVAGGSGITPLMSLAQTVLAGDRGCRVLLLYGNRSRGEIIFRDRLAELERKEPRLAVRHWIEDCDDEGRASKGRLTGDAVVDAVDSIGGRLFYVCGPEAMMDSVEARLLDAGVARDCISLERFTFAARPSAHRPTEGFPIHFADRDVVVRAAAGQTILEAGLAAGLPLAFSCTMGGCGACKLRVRKGSVVMDEPNCLSPAEAAAGHVLACVGYAAEPLTVQS